MKKFVIFFIFIFIFYMQLFESAQCEQLLNSSEKNSILNGHEFIPKDEINIILKSGSFDKNRVIFSETRHIINAIDPQIVGNENSYYPGLRGPNQLIIYTPKYGMRTGTNEYGTEAIVENNTVVSLNGADSIIPYNGFVISGHGRAKTWIMQNIQIGSKVYIDYYNNMLQCLLTPDSLVFAAKEKIREVNSLVEYYKKIDNLYNHKKANDYINSSKNLLQKAENKPEETQSFIKEIMTLLDNAIKNAIPYFNYELKGIWIRPVEDTPEKIQKTIERIYEAGITDIFLETFYHGKTIYNSNFLKQKGVISQREEFDGFDPLKIWIEEAHKRNMKVHVWFECFYLGNDDPKTTPGHILSIYPSWANKRLIHYDSIDPVPSLSEHNGYFLDPANSEVQEFVLGVLKEIIEKYDIDGINLDYIRYPKTVDPKSSNYASLNWGYTPSARAQFQTIYGIDPIDIKYGSVDWELWSLFRQNKISDFVRDVKYLANYKNIMVTAVIFPDFEKSLATNMQNWKLWSQRHYIDGLTPLLLSGDKNTAVMLLQNVIDNVNPNTQIYPGIFVTFMGGSFEDLLMQIHKSREYKTKGTIIFDYAHLSDKYTDALKTRIFNSSYDKENEKCIEIKKKETKKCNITTRKDYKPQVRYKDKKRK